MNRLEPLIDRVPERSGRARAWAVGGPAQAAPGPSDLRLFATAFVGGLVFFTTLFG